MGSSQDLSPSATAATPKSAAPWEDVAVEVTELMAASFEPLARKAADDIYARLMDTAQDYLADNIRFNLSSLLEAAEREAATQRKAVFDLGQINKALLNALLDMMPSNLGTPPDSIPDSRLLPVDMSFGEIRRARAAIARATGQSALTSQASGEGE